MIRSLITLTTIAALALPGAAAAHVTLQPPEAAAGSYVVENVRVPNEREDAATTKVSVQFPKGFASASYAPVPGWSAAVVTAAKEVVTITWTADKDAGIGPGEFLDFPISVKMPDAEGPLTFKAIQTYDDGETVRWIGDEASENPAPIVAVTATTGDEHGAGGQDLHSEQTQEAAAEDSAGQAEEGGSFLVEESNGLEILAIVVGGIGLVVGVTALVTARRKDDA